jgi:predicted outer membrane repeat protein
MKASIFDAYRLVRASKTKFTVTDSTFSSNHASTDGGALCCREEGRL